MNQKARDSHQRVGKQDTLNWVKRQTTFDTEYRNPKNTFVRSARPVPDKDNRLTAESLTAAGVRQKPQTMIAGTDAFFRKYLVVPTFYGPIVFWNTALIQSTRNSSVKYTAHPDLLKRLGEAKPSNPRIGEVLDVLKAGKLDGEVVLNAVLSEEFQNIMGSMVGFDTNKGFEIGRDGIVRPKKQVAQPVETVAEEAKESDEPVQQAEAADVAADVDHQPV